MISAWLYSLCKMARAGILSMGCSIKILSKEEKSIATPSNYDTGVILVVDH